MPLMADRFMLTAPDRLTYQVPYLRDPANCFMAQVQPHSRVRELWVRVRVRVRVQARVLELALALEQEQVQIKEHANSLAESSATLHFE